MASLRFQHGDVLRVVKGYELDPDVLPTGAIVTVMVVVNDGADWKGPTTGYIVRHEPSRTHMFPYVWNDDRFERLPPM